MRASFNSGKSFSSEYDESSSSSSAFDLNPLNEYAVRFDDQQIRQGEIIKRETAMIVNKSCIVDLDTFGMKELEQYLRNEPYNKDILKIVFCSIQNAFLRKKSLDGVATVINDNLSEFQILSAGSYGGVYRLVFKNNDHLFTLKVPFKGVGGHIHEFFIGLQLNKLDCPNFMYVYGVFSCFSDISDAFNQLCLEPTEYGRDRYFLLSEFIKGQDLQNLLRDIVFDDLLGVYFQILFALNLAHETFGFTHYDLHTSNIMLMDLNSTVYIPYLIDDGSTVYVKTRYLVKIIDYGFSYITYDRYPFGYIPVSWAYNPLKPSPLADVYRITGDITLSLAKNSTVMVQFLPFLKEFPSIESLVRNMNILQVTKQLNDLAEERWPVEEDDNHLDTPDLYVKMLNFAIDNIPGSQEIIVGAVPENGKIYSCSGQCTSIELIKDKVAAGEAPKRVKP